MWSRKIVRRRPCQSCLKGTRDSLFWLLCSRWTNKPTAGCIFDEDKKNIHQGASDQNCELMFLEFLKAWVATYVCTLRAFSQNIPVHPIMDYLLNTSKWVESKDCIRLWERISKVSHSASFLLLLRVNPCLCQVSRHFFANPIGSI